jgi:hypothetical protein
LTDQWQHVAFTFDSSNDFTFYVDGDFNSVRSAPGQILYDSDSKFLIGGAWATWNGTIDDVMIYDRVLSPGEIRQIYDAQK